MEIPTFRNKTHKTIYNKFIMFPGMKSFAHGLFFHSFIGLILISTAVLGIGFTTA